MIAEDPKVLIVEDQAIVGLDLVDSLEEQGCAALGSFKTPEQAMAAFDREAPDIGILDVNLGNGVTSEPIAAKLKEVNRPFAFMIGYVASGDATLEKFNAPSGCRSL